MQPQKLQQLLKSSDCISQSLSFLRQNIINQENNNNFEYDDTIEYYEKAIELKNAFRFLADGIQMNRALVQIQKQKIQKSKVFLQGLQYYKATLKTQLIQSDLQLIDIKDYIDQQPKNQIDWIHDYKAQHEKIINILQQIQHKKKLEEEKKLRKQQLKKIIDNSQDKYKKIFPQQVKKLYFQVNQASKLFNIKEIDTLQLSQFKSKKLQTIFSLLYSLKIKGQIDIKHTNLFDIEELQITIQKGHNQRYEYARQNKIMIEEKPFKFFIASLLKQSDYEKEEVLAISVSRREDFTTQQIFNNLLLQQRAKPIYSNPKSQSERNMNNKYSHLQWLGRVLASQSCLINGSQLIQKIKYKMFCLYLTRYAVENVVKKVPSYFFPVYKLNQTGQFTQKCLNLIQNKKILFSKFEKTNFQSYKKDIFIPDWVHKALNNYQILQQSKNLQYDNTGMEQSAIETNQIHRQNLDIFIANNNLQQLEQKDIYLYYRFQLLIEKNVLVGYLLIPTDYPTRRSKVRLIDYKKSQEKGQKVEIAAQINLSFEHNQLEIKNVQFTEELDEIQTQINQKIEAFLLQDGANDEQSIGKSKDSVKKMTSERLKRKEAFYIYFQINRLISYVIKRHIENENEK